MDPEIKADDARSDAQAATQAELKGTLKAKHGGARLGAGRPKGSRNPRQRRHAPRTQVEFQRQGAGYTFEVLGTIIRCLRAPDSSWADKLKASDLLLTHVHGRPAQQVQMTVRGVVEHKPIASDADLRAAMLELGCHPSLLPPPFLDLALEAVSDDDKAAEPADGRTDPA
jgi:hypothetical protein